MSTFKFHSSIGETVPWQATYTFPTQQTKVNKHVVKIVPKNGQTYVSGNRIRIEFPSDNYLNALNSILQFDLTVNSNAAKVATDTVGAAAAAGAATVTLGASAGTTLNQYVGSVLAIKTATGQKHSATILGYTVGKVATLDTPLPFAVDAAATYTVTGATRLPQGGAHNLISRIRVLYGSLVLEDIQNYHTLVRSLFEMGVAEEYMPTSGSILDGTSGGRFGQNQSGSATQTTQAVLQCSQKKTFCLNLMTGLMACRKLIPLKWMAAQLAIEITLAGDQEAFINQASGSPTMQLDNVNFIAEMVEFDSTYDYAFYQGLQQGVPLHFSSWHFHNFTLTGNTQNMQIHERSRSVKMALAVARDATEAYPCESDRFYHALGEYQSTSTGALVSKDASPITQYWWRVGGQYYPSQPVNCLTGAGEAYAELQKCIDALGDYQRSSNIDCFQYSSAGSTNSPGIIGGDGGKFIISGYFENPDASPDGISGINAEEQSDLMLQLRSDGAAVNKKLDVFVNYDSLLLIRDNNAVDLIL